MEIITFENFVKYGLMVSDNIRDGVPWSFTFNGHPVTHENDNLYLITLPDGQTLRFEKSKALFVKGGELSICDCAIYPLDNLKFGDTVYMMSRPPEQVLRDWYSKEAGLVDVKFSRSGELSDSEAAGEAVTMLKDEAAGRFRDITDSEQ